MSAEAVEAAPQEPVCKFAEGCHRVVACEPGCGERGPAGVLRADATLVGRAASAGMFLAGLIANSQLATVGSPNRLPEDLFPEDDPDTVRRVWERALAVGLHAGRRSASPALYRDEMDRMSAALLEAGYRAMGRSVARSRRLVASELTHPADAEAGSSRPTPV